MNVKSLREAIRTIAEFLEASGAGPRSKSLHAVHDLLEGHDEKTLEEFLTGLRHRSKQSKPNVGSSVANDVIVASYLQRLHAAGTDKSAFDQVFNELSKDKMVRKVEVDTIAHAYTGGRPEWPTKRLALQAIATWFQALAFDQTKMCRV